MDTEQKLSILVEAIQAELIRLERSQEPGITDMRYRLENALIAIGVEPYQPYPIEVLVIIQRQQEADASLLASEDEAHLARAGW